MANPYLQFVTAPEPPSNPYLAFTQPEEPEEPEDETPLERLRRNQEHLRAAGAMPGLGEEEEPTTPGRGLQHEAVSQVLSRVKRGIVGLGELPGVASSLQGAAQRAILPESLEPIATRREEERRRALEALTPDVLSGMAESVREEYGGAKERLADIGEGLGLPPAVTAGVDTALEGASLVADPTNFLPAGALFKGARGLGRAAKAVDEPLAELAAASQRIGASLPSVQKAARVVDATPQGSGALRRLRTLDADGNLIGEMSFTMEPGGGFRVMDVETVGQGTGGFRAMMEKAQGLADGPYMGAFAETDEGAAALARLRETNPEFFAHAPAAEPAGPLVQLSAGERGHLRIPVGAEEGSPTFFKRWFTTWGDYAAMGDNLGPATAEAKRLTGAAIKTEGKRAEMVVRDAALEIKRYHKALNDRGAGRSLDETLEYVLSGLEGEHAFDGAEVLGQRMAAAREHLDKLSRKFDSELGELLKGDLIKSPEWRERATELRGIIRQNVGKWNRRSFEAFTNADWEDLVKAPDSPERYRWDNFIEWAKKEIGAKEPGLAPEELLARAEGLGNKYLRRDPEVFLGFGERTLVPAEKLGSAKARLDLPEQIDDLLGLHKDPLVRYRESVLSLAHDIETLRFKRTLLEQGEGKVFFDQPTGNFSEQIRGATGLDPLAGRYTSPEIAMVINAASDGGKKAASLWAKSSSVAKMGATVYSLPVTHPRNMLSWVPMTVAQGHFTAAFNPRRWMQAAAPTLAAKAAKGGRLEGAIQKAARWIELADGRSLADVPALQRLDVHREHFLKMQKLGIVEESVAAGEVGHYGAVLGEVQSLNALKKTAAARGAQKLHRGAQWLYASEDNIGKTLGTEATLEDLRWAMPDAGEEQLWAETARRMRETSPTYSKIAPVTAKLRDNPFVSAFPTFSQEMIRNTKNGLVIALEDLRSANPRMRVLGAKRLGGLITATGASHVLENAGKYATGLTAGGLLGLREFMAPWDKEKKLAPLRVDGYKVTSVNVSYSLPHSYFLNPIVAAAVQVGQGEGPVKDVVDAAFMGAVQVFEPFISREILIDGVVDYIQDNRALWDNNKPIDVQARDIAHRIYRSVGPGTVKWMERAVRGLGVDEVLEGEAEKMDSGPDQAVVELVASLLQQTNQYGREYRIGEEMLAGAFGVRPITTDMYESLGFQARRFKSNYSDASSHKRKAEGHAGGLPPGTILERRREANQQFRSGWEELHRMIEGFRKVSEDSGKDRGIVDRDIRRKLREEEVGQKWIHSLMYGSYEDPW